MTLRPALLRPKNFFIHDMPGSLRSGGGARCQHVHRFLRIVTPEEAMGGILHAGKGTSLEDLEHDVFSEDLLLRS